MNKVFIDGMGKRGKIISAEINKYNIFKIVKSPKKADGIIIATPPETHYDRYKLFKDKPLLIEKPMCLKYIQALKMKNVMVGNNYMFSRTFDFLKCMINSYDLKISSISSNWSKCVDNKTDVVFDLGYHHIYIHKMLFGKMFNKIDVIPIDKKTKTMILYFGNKKSIINVSHNSNHKFYKNDFSIETDQGTYYIKEENNILELYNPCEKLIYSSDTGLYNELKLFDEFIDGKFKYNNDVDKNIIKWVEK